ncbi:MAG: alpha-E domain-containing protein [bacterium]|nr:alpha-E domain-containing protein [bacterium]
MLSRTAEAFFWIGRYFERAEYAARTIRVHHQIMLEHPDPARRERTWARLLAMGGDLETYQQAMGRLEMREALLYLAFDRENPNSLFSCIRLARENARTVQDQLSSEVWHHLNTRYLHLLDVDPTRFLMEPAHILQEIRDAGYTFAGLLSSTMLHDDRLAFCMLGRYVERAGRTIRLLNSGALTDHAQGSPGVTVFQDWVAVLRSASAYEAYRKTYRSSPEPAKIVEFLVLNPDFPRSVRFCAVQIREWLDVVRGTERRGEPARLTGQLAADMTYATVTDLYAQGLATCLEELQERLDTLSTSLGRTYFRQGDTTDLAPTPVQPVVRPVPRRIARAATIRQSILRVRQDFRYRYEAPVSGVRTLVRLVPNQRYGHQQLLDLHWHLEPPGEVRQHIDAFGNHVWQFDHDQIDRELVGHVEMVIQKQAPLDHGGQVFLHGVSPETESRAVDDAEFMALTPLVDQSDALVSLAHRLVREHPLVLDRAEAIVRTVGSKLRYRSGSTTVHTRASEAFAQGEGVCQDFSHVTLSLARLSGIPARYVSGYLPAEGLMHAWVELLVPDPETGASLWVAYDPTHHRRVDETYVTVAIGRDYQDIAPTGGFYTGTAVNALEVRVVARVEDSRTLDSGTSFATQEHVARTWQDMVATQQQQQQQ